MVKPDTIVHVAPGTYVGGLSTSASGVDGGRIYYVSDVKWGAKIVPSGSETIGWLNSGNYVTISGFDIDGQGGNGSLWRRGVYITGSHVTIENSHVHNIWTSSALPCDSSGGAGIVTDGYYYQEDHRVLNNVVDHVGFSSCGTVSGIYMTGAYTDVKNNLVYAIGSDGIVFYHDGTHANIGNNTVFNSNRGIILSANGLHNLTTAPDYFNVYNNIVFDNTLTGIGEGSGPLGIGQNNYYYNNLTFGNGGANMSLTSTSQPHESGTVYAAPQFVNYIRTGGGDYHLQSTSPAIDKGSPTNAPATDLDGVARPQGAGVDLGAYEYIPR